MDNNLDLREIVKEEVGCETLITVVGVGGGGSNAIAHLFKIGGFQNIKLVVANTDLQSLRQSAVQEKIVLGKKGQGAGMKPEKGKQAAEESSDEIRKCLEGSNLVIIAAGLGGGTGTGASPVFARVAKEIGALTIAVVTKPFNFEGSKRARLAEEGLKELYDICDSIVVIPNQKLLSVINSGTGVRESMSYVDDVLARAVNGISSVILDSGEASINVDFQDLCTIMEHRGFALMGIGEAEGKDAAENAIRNAIESPLFDNMSVNGASGLIVNFEYHPTFSFESIANAVAILQEAVKDDANIMFGTIERESFDPHRVKVSVIATGFENQTSTPMETPKRQDNVAPQAEYKQDYPQEVRTEFAPDVFVHKVVSNGDYEDDIDIPTYLRHQKD